MIVKSTGYADKRDKKFMSIYVERLSNSPAAEEPQTRAEVMIITGRINFSASMPTMNPATTERKN